MSGPVAPAALIAKAHAVLAQGALLASAPEAPPSPCISVCRMDEDRVYCVGCLRTLDELRQWGKADAAARRSIWMAVLERCELPAPVVYPVD